MADTREYVQKFANENGGDIFVEDVKLAEADHQTTISDEEIVLKGTDGVMHKIDKSSFSEAVRGVLGPILYNLSKESGITKVLTMSGANANAADIGTTTLANLASVLGVPTFISRVRTTLAQGEYKDITLYYGGVLFVTAITPGGVVNSAGVSLGYYGGSGVVVSIYKYGETLGINDASKPCNITAPNPHTFRITSVSGTTSIGYIGMQVWQ